MKIQSYLWLQMKYRYPALLFICFIVFLLLYNPANLYFLSDDFDSVLKVQNNSYILHSYRPLADLTIKTDYLFWGGNAAGYYFTNILLHFFSTTVLYFFSKQLYSIIFQQPETNKYAFFTALFFLFYPYHSEPLFWIVGRGGTLCTLMALLSLYFYLKKQNKPGNYWLSLFFLMAAAFSYEAAWILPLIISVISLMLTKKGKWRKELPYALIFWFTFLIYLAIRFYLTKHVIGSPYGTDAVLSSEIFHKVKNFGALAARSVIPPAKSTTLFIFFFLLLTAFVIFAFYKLKNQWNVILKITIPSFFICLLPVISFGINIHDTESERFLYLPSVFFSISFLMVLIILFKKQFLPVFSAILISEIALLFYNYKSFEASSLITKQTVKTFSTLNNMDNLYCINLPSQYRGAYIFRNGFESAIKLYTGVKNVEIISKLKIQNDANHVYNVIYLTKNDAIKNGLIDSSKIKGRAVIFNWKEDELEVYK